AETGELRLARQYGLDQLPLMVVEHERLLDRELAERGLPPVKIEWVSAPTAETVPGERADVGVLGVTALAALWDRTAGTAAEGRALAAMETAPFVLVSRNPAINTIRDFGNRNRIAVSEKSSTEALVLAMAAAQEWGIERLDKLDALVVARPPAEAMAS